MSVLATCPLFHDLPAAQLEALAAAAQPGHFTADTVIFQEGDPGDGLYLVESGKVQVSCLVTPGDRRVLSEFGAGEFFGEMAVLDAQPRSATVTAVEETRLVFLGRELVLGILEDSPQVAVSLVREVVQRMREFNQTYTREVVQAERLALVGRFARSIVHDFKNPLNIIGISADMSVMEKANPEMRLAARARIRRQVDRLSNMINELLEFTRGGTAAVVPAQVDYAGFLRPLLDEIGQEIEPRRVTIVCETEPPSVPVTMDPRRMTHVFHNLINNACDAMPDGGRIHVRFALQGREIVTELRDTGQGIAPEIASRLFDAFATYGKASGTGLGLSICRRIVEDHHGRIEARNAPEGGAVFSVALPRLHPESSPGGISEPV